MKNFIKNYKGTLVLLASIIIGAIAGLIFKEKTEIVKPFGDIFLNLLLVSIVPLIFLTITTSISKMKSPKRIGKIMASIIGVFVVTSLIACLIGFFVTKPINLVNVDDTNKIKEIFDMSATTEEVDIAESTVNLITVNDFNKLLSRNNLIALLIFSIIVGIAINMSGKKADKFRDVLVSANEVMQNIIKIIMYYAPIGLGCYFAYLIGTFGASIGAGFLKTFVVYTIVSVLFYIIFYTLYAFVAGGKSGVKAFWKNALPSTITSLATCSSAASIPVNVESAKKMGVPDDIAETTIPMGTSFHKDGSIIGSVFKIMFLVCLFGTEVNTFKVLGVALLANLLITGVPIGGGTISEMMILTLMGYPVEALPILTMIATIIDPPATMLNVVGDTTTSMLVARIVDGKKWLKKTSK
ncbi:MAG: dicarboxylate/amino acid:cation symporter [Bacilli bacterium]|nr:dicarboxylate/amino acid:cation symporter [Bacilli bacterium]